ncbi:hypothetical protein CFC21_100963 [Triticum aestivum]|uniref:Bifunctional inhibitor/plant lipid transfer protein/seed storage helical domain-containing protein n=2 Tax=Triticum aestivum TaxID=4565 RepID=A0A9R1M263_WHEAT|nr:hypothetical protein CFC21_100963 [Triticum aestivum]
MASSRILLLAAILLALASVQAHGQSMPPSPAMAPAPSAGGGKCNLNGAVSLGVCLNLQPGRTSPSDKNRCCHRIQGMGMQRAADCLCMTFMLAGGLLGADVANGVNSVLGVCGMARIRNLVCQMASVTV